MTGVACPPHLSDEGFTLLEVIFALLVLNVGLLGVLGMLWMSAQTFTRARLLQDQVLTASALTDSLAIYGVEGAGEWRYRWGTIRLEGGESLRIEGGDSSWLLPAP
jgi:predicted small integral membrane protein